MFKFFSSIVELITVVVDFVVDFFAGIMSMVASFTKSIGFVYEVMTVLPDFLLAVIGVLLACCFIRFILKKGAPDA